MPSKRSTVLWSVAAAAVGGLVGYELGALLCGTGGSLGALLGGTVEVSFTGSTCSIAGTQFPCDEIVARLSALPRDTRVVLFASLGVHQVVEDTIEALAQAGFTDVAVST